MRGRTVCVVTTSRADYGLLSRLMQEIRQDPDLFSSGSTNLYLYALADPVNLIDPDGRKYEEGDFEKSNNGPPEAMEDATGTHERINETECFLFACWETGDYEEMGVMDDGLSYHRVCENGTCVETVYDPQTGLSGSVSVDIQCEGANCDDVGRRAKSCRRNRTDTRCKPGATGFSNRHSPGTNDFRHRRRFERRLS